MFKLLRIFALSSAFILPSTAFAKNIQISADMKSYRGPAAYMAVYLTKPDGSFHSTLAVFGGKSKYRRHLRGWHKGVASIGGRVDGITGASVGAKRTMKVDVNIADALIDAGYKINVDTAVEDVGQYRSEVAVPLKSTGSQAVPGRGFVKTFKVNL